MHFISRFYVQLHFIPRLGIHIALFYGYTLEVRVKPSYSNLMNRFKISHAAKSILCKNHDRGDENGSRHAR